MPRSPWLRPDPLLLASTSPTRRLLLESAALPVETASPDIDERALESSSRGLSPPALALRLARAKADAVSNTEMSKMTSGLPLPPGFKLPF